jgi:Ca2+-transporting ATPase
MAVVTLGVIAWATPVYDEAIARTMGLTVFSLANIWFAFETAHEEKSIVSAETLANPTLLKAGVAAIIATVAASELGLLNRILDTVNLTTEQWAICLVLSLAVVAVAEIKQLLRISTSDAPQLATPEAAAPAAAGAS